MSDTHGKRHSLSMYRDKFVVLEWTNYECPFVKKHYGTGNMQKLQRGSTRKGVVWLTVNSSAPGKQGHYPPERWDEFISANDSAADAVLLDLDGDVGRAYGATATPHMFVIDPKGVLVHAGAIDDQPSWKPETVKQARNYVRGALESAMSGGQPKPSRTQPFGCSVKY